MTKVYNSHHVKREIKTAPDQFENIDDEGGIKRNLKGFNLKLVASVLQFAGRYFNYGMQVHFHFFLILEFLLIYLQELFIWPLH